MELLILYITLLVVVIQTALCSVKLEIKFVQYSNHGGTGVNGHCCDGRSIFCFSACDHRFVICLDKAPSNSDINKCAYGIRRSSEISNQDKITFYGTIGNLRNPLEFTIDDWPGDLTLKVDVFDVDDNEDDKVDFLKGDFTVKVGRNRANSTEVPFRLSTDRTLLDYKARAYCEENYYGGKCDVFCVGKNDTSGRFTCNETTGDKVCMPGWSGGLCDDDSVNECEQTPEPCNETQVCVDTRESYLCTCPGNFTGPFCNETELTCPGDYCLNNGTCEVLSGNFTCNCTGGWSGENCETESIGGNPCGNNPCLRNGTCQPDTNNTSGFTCECPLYTSGELCQNISACLDDINPCVHGICEIDESSSDFHTCICSEGYYGDNCDVAEPLSNIVSNATNVTDISDLSSNFSTKIVFSTTTRASLSNVTELAAGNVSQTTEHVSSTVEGTTEKVIVSTTVQIIQGITTTGKSTTTTPPEKRATVYLRGKVDSNNKSELGKALVDLIHRMTDIAGKVYLDLKVDTYRTSEGEIISEIKAKGFSDGKEIDIKEIQKIFNSNNSIVDHVLPLPRYFENRGHTGNTHVHRISAKEEGEHDSWIHHYWYVVLIAVLAIVACVIFITGIIIHKRKKTIEPSENNNGAVPTTSPNVTEATTAQSFENSLYFQMNQPQRT